MQTEIAEPILIRIRRSIVVPHHNIAMTPPEISIRIATEKDLPQLLHLYAQPDMDGESLSIDEALPIFQEMLMSNRQEVFVAESHGQILGTFSLSYVQHLTHRGSRSASFGDIVVNKISQGSGVGKLMMIFAAKRAQEKGCYKLMLSTSTHREGAQAFYEGLGYRRHGFSYLLDI